MNRPAIVPGVPSRPLRIAWVGALPMARETGGVPGVATELLAGLAALGHQIDCFAAGAAQGLPERLQDNERIRLIAGRAAWRWDRWYSRTRITAFLSGLIARAFGLVALRREVARRHDEQPYDLIYQFSAIESVAVPGGMARSVPLVIHPETHAAGELRFLISERRLALRCQPAHNLLIAVAVMWMRSLVQRRMIRRARLLVCISEVFRDHLVADYGFPLADTVVIPNPVRLARFSAADAAAGRTATVLVLGRVAVRKGVEDVLAVARLLDKRDDEAQVRVRIVGGPDLWSDYTKLLEQQDLPPNCEYARRVPPSEVPGELARAGVLLQASRYEPFALTVGEALAAGMPVVATSEVGAIEQVDRSVATVLAPGDVAAMADAVLATLARMRAEAGAVEAAARAEAERLFAPALVSAAVSDALERVVPSAQPAAG
jgi:glycosyltransferase involved in cell wall biosynthesis